MPAAWYNFYFSLLRLLSLLLWLPLALFLFCSSYFCLFLLWCGPTALARGQATLEAHQILNSLRLWHTIFGLELGHGQRLGLGLGMCMMWERQRQPHREREREMGWQRRKSVEPAAYLAQANERELSKKQSRTRKRLQLGSVICSKIRLLQNLLPTNLLA